MNREGGREIASSQGTSTPRNRSVLDEDGRGGGDEGSAYFAKDSVGWMVVGWVGGWL